MNAYQALGRLSAALPCSTGLKHEIEERFERLSDTIGEDGFDHEGTDPKTLVASLLPAALLYRHWFRTVTDGTDKLPAGRMLLVGNHGGQIPIDRVMVTTALLLEAEPPRLARAMAASRPGPLPSCTPETGVEVLEHDGCVLCFPEGVRGMNKLYADAYQLQPFDPGFMRLALRTATPVVPFAVVGSEEQAPAIANIRWLARLLGTPGFPITPTWPWLGALGLIPLPARYRIEFATPMVFDGDPDEGDEAVEAKVAEVKAKVQAMLREALADRRSIFL